MSGKEDKYLGRGSPFISLKTCLFYIKFIFKNLNFQMISFEYMWWETASLVPSLLSLWRSLGYNKETPAFLQELFEMRVSAIPRRRAQVPSAHDLKLTLGPLRFLLPHASLHPPIHLPIPSSINKYFLSSDKVPDTVLVWVASIA